MDKLKIALSNYFVLLIVKLRLIKPKWADHHNKNKIMNPSVHPDYGDYKIFRVAIKDLIDIVDLNNLNVNNLILWDENSDYRIRSTSIRWLKGQFVDPPFLSTSNNKYYKLSISDGRHRFKLTYLLKKSKIPVAVHNTMVAEISSIIVLGSY